VPLSDQLKSVAFLVVSVDIWPGMVLKRISIKRTKRLVLIGDSSFDNASYISGAPDIRTKVEMFLPDGWAVALLAKDCSTVSDAIEQLGNADLKDTTHLAISVGGNNALEDSSFLGEKANSVADVLTALSKMCNRFEKDYNRMLTMALSLNVHCILCTIYYPLFYDATTQTISAAALAFYNDCIIRAAVANALPLLDLRLICTEESDYANPIEPSASGGEKIARSIAKMVLEHDFSQKHTCVYGPS